MTKVNINNALNTWSEIIRIWETFDKEYFNNTLDTFEIKEFYDRENDNSNIDVDIFYLQNKEYEKHYNKEFNILTRIKAKDVKIPNGVEATFVMLSLSASYTYTVAVWIHAFVHDIKNCYVFTGDSNTLLNKIIEACEIYLEADDYLQWKKYSRDQFPIIYNLDEIKNLSQCDNISIKEIIFLAIMNTYLFITNNTVIACDQNAYGI